jgi:hypothetical protein
MRRLIIHSLIVAVVILFSAPARAISSGELTAEWVCQEMISGKSAVDVTREIEQDRGITSAATKRLVWAYVQSAIESTCPTFAGTPT